MKVERTLTHGNAVGIYFFDPEGNRCEVYWRTGLDARQPFGVPVDLSAGREAVQALVTEAVARFGKTGVFGPAAEALAAELVAAPES